MNQIKKCVKMLNPFNNMDEMPAVVYMVKKVLAFCVIFMVSALVAEGIVIAGLLFNGYNFMQGEMPGANVMNLMTYYGYIVHIAITILFWKIIEKRPLKSMGFNKRVLDYILGTGIAIVLLTVIMVAICLLGKSSYMGLGKNTDWLYLLALLGGFIVQGMAEETMCRGFLMHALDRKIPTVLTILVSATAFAYPHFSTLFEAKLEYAIVGTINLYFIATIFSLLVLWRKNIWVACGLHSIWNFILYGVFGLSVSGSGENASGVICFQVDNESIINGGQYGIEASIVTAIVLGVVIVILARCYQKSIVEK